MKILHILYQSTPDTAGSSIRSRDIIASQLIEGIFPIVISLHRFKTHMMIKNL